MRVESWFKSVGVVAIGVLLTAMQCEGERVLSVRIDADTVALAVGQTTTYVAVVETAGGATAAVSWASSNAAIASVDAEGRVTGRATGEATITATSRVDAARHDSVLVRVLDAPAVTSVTIEAGRRVVAVGSSLTLRVAVEVHGGASDSVVWSSSDPSIATVSATGEVQGIATGSAEVSATSVLDDRMRDAVTISVVAAAGDPATIEIATGDGQVALAGTAVATMPAAIVRDASGVPVVDVPVTFEVTAGGGTVEPTTPLATDPAGMVTASRWVLGEAPGANEVTAFLTGSPSIRVAFEAIGTATAASPLTSTVTANPDVVPARPGATSELTIWLHDADGEPYTAGGVTISFADPGVEGSAVDEIVALPDGAYGAVFTAGATPGEATIAPLLDGVPFAATATITVRPAALSVALEPRDPTLAAGQSMQLSATVATSGGASEAIDWRSSDEGVATVNAHGVVTAIAPGSADITATSWVDHDVHDSVRVDVVPGTVTNASRGSYVWLRNLSLSSEGELPGGAGSRMIALDLGWSESWHGPATPPYVDAGAPPYVEASNWDAAWVFAKFRVGDGDWRHASLRRAGHVTPANALVNGVADGRGVFIQRRDQGYGAFAAEGVRLIWDAVADGAREPLDVRVFAIEMVYVPSGAFHLGAITSGPERSAFREGATGTPFRVTRQDSISIGSGEDQLSPGAGGATNPRYPTGFNGFYVMKYQITQGQYVEFLNTLSQDQADRRMHTGSDHRYAISGTGVGGYTVTRPLVAMHYASWADLAAFLDWAGMRPMTEMEYEKAARGPVAPAPRVFAWGDTPPEPAATLHFSSDLPLYPDRRGEEWFEGNVVFGNHLTGPVRVGGNLHKPSVLLPPTPPIPPWDPPVFPMLTYGANTSSAWRDDVGTSFYGVMELSGHLWERVVTIGHDNGRRFDGTLHGDGELDAHGNADVETWPSAVDPSGIGARGGSWRSTDERDILVSDRSHIDLGPLELSRSSEFGGRGVRSGFGW